MSAAPFVWRPDGRPDWRAMWETFCDLALHGGPPHRGADRALRLPYVAAEDATPDPAMLAEIRRGIWETTGLFAEVAAPGWLGVTCDSPAMAAWLAEAIAHENVEARADHDRLLLVAGPGYRLDDEVKSVITVVAKTHHYWDAHGDGAEGDEASGPRVQFRCVRCGLDFLVSRAADPGPRDATCPIDGAVMARWDGPPTARRGRHAQPYAHAHGPGLPVHTHGTTTARPLGRTPRGIPTPLVVGVGGPAGSGKTTLIEAIRRCLAGRLRVAVVATLGDDAPSADLLLVERTGGRAVETFTPDLVDATIGVVGLATAADDAAVDGRWRLLVVNRRASDPDLPRPDDTARERPDGPVVVADLAAAAGGTEIVAWLERELLLGR
jgi:sirohydrochlorin cobaltochelatase